MKNVFYKKLCLKRLAANNRCIMRARNAAFTLAEVLAALIVGSMVLVAVLVVYGRARDSVDAATTKLDNSRLPNEVLQRIAEDLDDIVAADKSVKITVKNALDGLYPTASLTISKTIYDEETKKPKTLEQIVWQTSYDYDSALEGLVLYRSHTGIVSEDKLLDQERADLEKDYSFVPVCEGVTFFTIEVPKGENMLDIWTAEALPPGIVITISFGQPYKSITGEFDVPDEEKSRRTIAIGRTRKIKLEIPIVEMESDIEDADEPNEFADEEYDSNEPNEPSPVKTEGERKALEK